MRIVIASIDMKPSRCLVHTIEGKKYGVWNDKVGKWNLEAGGAYDVEIETTEVNGRSLTNIVSAKRIAGATPATPSRPAASRDHSEQIFVVALLKSLIEAGEVKNDKTQLWTTTQMLRGLYRHTFGFDAMNQHMEAAE